MLTSITYKLAVFCCLLHLAGCGQQNPTAGKAMQRGPLWTNALSLQIQPLSLAGKLDWADWTAVSMVALDDAIVQKSLSVPQLVDLATDLRLPCDERFALFIAGWEFLLPDHERGPRQDRAAQRDEQLAAWAATIRERQLAAAACLVAIAPERPDVIDIYTHFVLWSRTLVLPYADSDRIDVDRIRVTQAPYLRRAIEDTAENPHLQNWYLRDFIVLAHALDRDDLFVGVADRKALTQNAIRWFGELTSDPGAVATRPEVLKMPSIPLVDWSGSAPPPLVGLAMTAVMNPIYTSHFFPDQSKVDGTVSANPSVPMKSMKGRLRQ